MCVILALIATEQSSSFDIGSKWPIRWVSSVSRARIAEVSRSLIFRYEIQIQKICQFSEGLDSQINLFLSWTRVAPQPPPDSSANLKPTTKGDLSSLE